MHGNYKDQIQDNNYRQREREKEGMDSERSTSNVPNK